MAGKHMLIFLWLSLWGFACSNEEIYECPCGGYGVVAHGTIITIEEQNPGDTRKILDALESALGGKCCYREDPNYEFAQE